MKFRGFFSPIWEEIFSFNGIADFHSICALQNPSNENPAHYPVIKSLSLNLPRGGKTTVLLKQYIPCAYEKFKKFFFFSSKFEREINFFLKLKKFHIQSPEIIYFNSEESGAQRSILIMCEPTYFNSLQKIWIEWKLLPPSFTVRVKVLMQIAQLIRLLHAKKIIHNQLTTDHIGIRYRKLNHKLDCDQIYTLLLGVEKAHKTWFRSRAMLNDLSRLFASLKICSYTDKVRFYKFYRCKKRLSRVDKWRLRLIFKRASKINKSKNNNLLKSYAYS